MYRLAAMVTFFTTVVTPGLLHFAIFCQIFEKTQDCYTFLTFFVTVREAPLYQDAL